MPTPYIIHKLQWVHSFTPVSNLCLFPSKEHNVKLNNGPLYTYIVFLGVCTPGDNNNAVFILSDLEGDSVCVTS